MLVWTADKENGEPRIVILYDGTSYVCVKKGDEGSFCNGGIFNLEMWLWAEELPEPKPMTAIDVMWWAGNRKVARHINDTEFYSAKDLDSDDDIHGKQWNELIRENGETKLKYEEWKPFTFDECDMGEG
jgi:hypothetical protein